MLDVLVVAPHPDDAELGMGGAILNMQSHGLSVGVLDLTDGEPTPHGSIEIRRQETAAASQVLGLKWRKNLGLPNRRLQPTLEARAQLAGVIRQARPRWLFAPYWRTPIRTMSPPRSSLRQRDSGPNSRSPTFPRSRTIRADLLLLLRSFASCCAACLHPRYQRSLGGEVSGNRLLRKPVHHRPRHGSAHVPRQPARRSGLLGQDDRPALRRTVRLPRARRDQRLPRFCVGDWLLQQLATRDETANPSSQPRLARRSGAPWGNDRQPAWRKVCTPQMQCRPACPGRRRIRPRQYG